MKFFRFSFLLTLFLTPQLARSAVPSEAKTLLESLPDKRITLPLVVGAAVKDSDSYREVRAALAVVEVPYLQSRIPLDYQLSFEASVADEKTEPSISFMPSRKRATSFKLGASTYFSSGTTLAAELSHGWNQQALSTNPNFSFYETRASLSIQQNLWKDAFGKATRLGKEAGKLSRDSNEAGFEKAQEEWLLSLIGLYYQAWLTQAQAKAAQDNVNRRERLMKITRTKMKRGTAEKPDLLQVESAHLNAKVGQAKADQALMDRWRELVVALKFPHTWLTVDPKHIPMDLDAPFATALQACGPLDKPKTAPKDDATTRKATLIANASQLLLEAAENGLAPNLILSAGLIANGIHSDRGPSFDETIRIDNAGWQLALTISMPLYRYAEEIEVRQAIAENMRAEAQAAMAVDQLKRDWLKACSEYHQLQASYQLLKTAFKNQQNRAQLEERRFGVGRVPTINVIQAGDDATQAELTLQQAEMERRLAAWQVLRMVGYYKDYVKSLIPS